MLQRWPLSLRACYLQRPLQTNFFNTLAHGERVKPRKEWLVLFFMWKFLILMKSVCQHFLLWLVLSVSYPINFYLLQGHKDMFSFRSVIILALRLSLWFISQLYFCIWYEVGFWGSVSPPPYGSPVVPAAFVGKTFLSLLDFLLPL